MTEIREPIFELDEEEKDFSDSFDRGEWKSVSNLKHEIALAKQAAKNYFQDKERVTVSIQTSDMASIRRISAEKGLKPQTYIASIMHQIAAGHIKG
jgi:predicted DNA binding CopG/RHH family protein